MKTCLCASFHIHPMAMVEPELDFQKYERRKMADTNFANATKNPSLYQIRYLVINKPHKQKNFNSTITRRSFPFLSNIPQ